MENPSGTVIWRTTSNVGLLNIFEINLVKPPAAKVHLIDFNHDPYQMIAKVTSTYKGILEPDDVEQEIIDQALDDLKKTPLQTPAEMLHFVFLIKDVTRAFTHQLVRYRVGTSFAQESMRFYGAKRVYRILVTGNCAASGELGVYSRGVASAIQSYAELLDQGVPSEDARGVLPTNILTSIFFSCSMRTLQQIYTQRMCCQAQQGEWQVVLPQMRKLIEYEMDTGISDMLSAPYERGEPCGYRASFDRPCKWQKG
jgi:flavin-dependent thymidylate synthase